MTAETLMADLNRRGIRLTPDGPDLIVEPASKLTYNDRTNIRNFKGELLARLRTATPDSRQTLICPEVRVKLEAVEADARSKGWPAELLWNNAFWDLPRGLAALLNPGDEIGEVTAEYIEIWKLRRDRQRFMRRVA